MPAAGKARLQIVLHGTVQGVGFRPFVYRLAEQLNMSGWVSNSAQGVHIEVEAARPALEEFLRRLDLEKPPHSSIHSLKATWLEAVGGHGFEIRDSKGSGVKTALVLPDIATCPECLRDILNPQNRRYRYPFTNCTHCGPRFSIVESLPYDRENTSMKSFPMCPACRREYSDPRDRRFHAQPNACPVCGPQLELWSVDGEIILGGDPALRSAAQMIRRGKIVAVKGVGGFHLLADARNERSVRLLRERKHREEKPFALMFPTISAVRLHCDVSALEEQLLLSPAAPIVLLRRIPEAQCCCEPDELDAALRCCDGIAASVAPGNPNLGVMLPSNPLHHLLMLDLDFPVVATSGNLSDEPLCTDEHEALERLRGIADFLLVHNRPIVRPEDDSIVRVMAGREMVLRRSRGYAPLPVTVAAGILPAVEPGLQPGGRRMDFSTVSENPGAPFIADAGSGGKMPPSTAGRMPAATVLAVGAHLKNTVALATGDQVFLSQHIGDLETEAAHRAFWQAAQDLPKLYDANVQVIAADLHPEYLSTKYAVETCQKQGGGADASAGKLPAARLVGVQHHVAHVLSCMVENEVAAPVLGVAWDGTGYGPDATVWGGEFFYVTEKGVARVAHLRPFRLPGGDKAVKEPRRVALGLLFELYGEAVFEMQHLPPLRATPPVEMITLRGMLQRRFNSPLTSSMGRLFDAVASLIDLRQQMRFEGQAAMELEFAIGDIKTDAAYDLRLAAREDARAASQPSVIDWSSLIGAILSDVRNGVAPGFISAKFHNALAELVITLAKKIGEPRVVLSGGCFQNRYLLERAVGRLRAEKFQPIWHQRVPTNDGGIALGQIYAARRGLNLK